MCKETRDSNDTAGGGATRSDMVPKSESSVRNAAYLHHSRVGDTARVLSIHEDLALGDIDMRFCSMREENWAAESAPDVDPQQVLGSVCGLYNKRSRA